jgi:Rrf2 family protein
VFKTETQYALRAVAVLTHSGPALSISVIAEKTQSPAPMMAKVLYRLAQNRLVKGRPGPSGGYKLARPAKSIKLAEIVRITEGPDFGRYCLFGMPQCSDSDPCPLHNVWGPVRQHIFDMIENFSVADLAAGKVKLSKRGKRK